MTLAPADSLTGRSCQLDLRQPKVMGILNVTPDSFSDGGCFDDPEVAFRHGLRLQREGAALLDIGGESTRPGAPSISADEELSRVLPVIRRLRNATDLPLSIDTTKAAVAAEAVAAGADFINDISGLNFDSEMARVAADSGAGLFLMHTRGRPEEMQQDTNYRDLLAEVSGSLQQSLSAALAAGVKQDKLAIDPGIGFGKSSIGNLELLNRLAELHRFACPILLGTSRKSFIGQVLRQNDPQQRAAGTLATVALGVAQGVQLFRVHEVRPALEAALVAWAVREIKFPYEH